VKIPLYQIDAFTDKIFGGNPAAVCPLESWPEDELMQNLAAENNLSETAFFVKNDFGYALRWFTPEMEIDLCGHATLATAYVLFNYLNYGSEKIIFDSKSGILEVTKNNGLITLDFPATKPWPEKAPKNLIKGLGAKPKEVLKSRDYLAVFDDEETILAIKPDFEILKKLDALGIIVTAPGREADFVSRFFAPAAGINEDPVTGSAHVTLVPYWAEVLGKKELHAYQLSKRKGELFCTDADDRVLISGNAATYSIGAIVI
jgi:PhzF family phenazine biosynthesis protein